MTWRNQYWDMVYNFYWNPIYIGMASLNPKTLSGDSKFIHLPREWINSSGPIYKRNKKASAQFHNLSFKEEILNHFFNLFFAIAPDKVAIKAFCEPLDVRDEGPFKFVGREIVTFLGVDDATFGQHDALFVSAHTAIAIELKLEGFYSSPSQFLKYLALLVCLKRQNQNFKNFGLIYVCAKPDKANFLKKSHLSADARLWRDYLHAAKPGISKIVLESEALTDSIAAELNLLVMTWSDLHSTLKSIYDSAHGSKRPVAQAIERLFAGFLEQIEQHNRTCISDHEKLGSRLAGVDPIEVGAWLKRLDQPELLSDVDLRKALTAFVVCTRWGTSGVLEQCAKCTIDELRDFVDALKNDGQISLKFRWAVDSDTYPFDI